MTILPYTHEDHIYRVLGEYPVIAGHCRFRIIDRSYIIHLPEGHKVENGAAKEIPKTLGSILRKTYIFVHMKGMDTAPVDTW